MPSVRFELLTDEGSNVKLEKSTGSTWYSVGLSLAPHASSGVMNTCSHASPECIRACVAWSGNGNMPSVHVGRTRKTAWFRRDKATFLAALRRDLHKAVRVAEGRGLRVSCRLNVFSDLPWERIAPGLFAEFPDIQFYDYTKNPVRAAAFSAGLLPPNYHLTFSRSEENERAAVELLLRGVSVAVVFPQFRGSALPETWHGFTVIDGDKHDLRFTDPRGVVVGLRAKGAMRSDTSGMVDRSPTDASLLDTLS